MSQMLYLVNKIVKLLPPTRFFPLKARLWRACGLDIHPSAKIVSSAVFIGKGIHIEQEAYISHDVFIAGTEGGPVRIGVLAGIAPRSTIISGTHDIDMVGLRTAGREYCLPITIEDGVWVGVGSTIVGGVTIGKKAMIGAGSVVVNDIPPYCLAVGVPCKPIKYWDIQAGEWSATQRPNGESGENG